MIKIDRQVHTFDATGKAVGRLASEIATLLRGKNKPEYQPYLDLGDVVYVENIKKLKFSGQKLEQKKYHRFTDYIGNLKTENLASLFAKNPPEVLRRAVREMLPPTKLRPQMMKRLIIR